MIVDRNKYTNTKISHENSKIMSKSRPITTQIDRKNFIRLNTPEKDIL